MSAFKVQEAFVYPIMNPKLGTSLIMTELYITWLAPMKGFSSTVTYNLENNYYFSNDRNKENDKIEESFPCCQTQEISAGDKFEWCEAPEVV